MNIYTMESLKQQFEPLLHEKVWKYTVVTLIIEGQVIFIIRSLDMPTHSGHVGFFGGAKKEGEDFNQAAIREFEEETSLSGNDLQFKGFAKPCRTRNGSVTIPVVYEINQYDLKTFMNSVKSNGEWDETFSIPITDLKSSDNWSYSNLHKLGECACLYFFDHSKTNFGRKRKSDSRTLLWGMTAHVVYNLFRMT